MFLYVLAYSCLVHNCFCLAITNPLCADTDGDALVSLDEFKVAVRIRMKVAAVHDVKSADARDLMREKTWERLLSKLGSLDSGWQHRLEALFLELDSDCDGSLSMSELGSGLCAIGCNISPKQLEGLQSELDPGGLDRVTLPAFSAVVLQRMKMTAGKRDGEKTGPNAVKAPQSRSVLQTFSDMQLAEYKKASFAAWEKVVRIAQENPAGLSRGLKEMYATLDADRSGKIDVAELAAGFKNLGIFLTKEQVIAFKEDIDSDGDGLISESEFLTAVRSRIKVAQAATSRDPVVRQVEEAWQQLLKAAVASPLGWKKMAETVYLEFDHDASGDISVEELGQGLKKVFGIRLPPVLLRAFSHEFSVDSSNQVSFEAFTSAINARMKIAVVRDNRGKAITDTMSSSELAEYAKISEKTWGKVLKIAEEKKGSWLKNVTALFRHMDKDNSGTVSIVELAKGLKYLGIKLNAAQIVAFRDDIDADADGEVSLEEFITAVRIRMKTTPSQDAGAKTGLDAAAVASLERIWKRLLDKMSEDWQTEIDAMFLDFDSGGNGEIELDELRAGLVEYFGVNLNSSELVLFRNELDDDGSGGVSLSELKMAVHQRQRMRAQAEGKRFLEEPQIRRRTAADMEKSEKAWSKILKTAQKDLSGWRKSIQDLFKKFDKVWTSVCLLIKTIPKFGLRTFIFQTQIRNGFVVILFC